MALVGKERLEQLTYTQQIVVTVMERFYSSPPLPSTRNGEYGYYYSGLTAEQIARAWRENYTQATHRETHTVLEELERKGIVWCRKESLSKWWTLIADEYVALLEVGEVCTERKTLNEKLAKISPSFRVIPVSGHLLVEFNTRTVEETEVLVDLLLETIPDQFLLAPE